MSLSDLIKSKVILADKPEATTARGWREWEKKARETQPLAYWLNETAADWCKDVWRGIKKPFQDVRYGLRYRFLDRYHQIPTGLEPGYYDCDTRMLNGMFNLLVDFVEVEKAWMQVTWGGDKPARKKHPWWSKGWTRFKSFRDPEAGLRYLKWEMTLDSKFLKDYERSDRQALVAKEIWHLYDWWKNQRPNRPDPHDASGWSALCAERRERQRAKGEDDVLGFLDFEDETPDDRKRSRKCLDAIRKIEDGYDAEDEEMLIRLIKIRKSLWT